MKYFSKGVILLIIGILSWFPTSALAAKSSFKIAWSIYVGWMPWPYAQQSGILKKWADKYDIEIELVQVNDYVESINLYTAGSFDGCVMTNMDALTIPAVGGVDSTALIVGDFSNGNDGVVAKGASDLKGIKGENVYLAEFSVSHYLLARGLVANGMTERDVKVINAIPDDLVAAFTATEDMKVITTWNPLLAEARQVQGANLLFDSSQIPGEIIDMMVVNTKTLEENPKLGKALVGAWYETMQVMSTENPKKTEALETMAKDSGATLDQYIDQLNSTKMFYQSSEALEFYKSNDVRKTMDHVRNFAFDNGLYAEGAPSPDVVGIQFADGSVLGDSGNVKLRFNASYTEMANSGKL